MIGVFEGMVRQNPQRTCFTFVDKEGNVEAFSYREARMMAAGLASLLRRRGVEPGDAVVVDLPNNPAFVIMLLAAAYGGFSLITMNTRLTDAEKQARLLDLQRSRAVNVAYTVDMSNAAHLLPDRGRRGHRYRRCGCARPRPCAAHGVRGAHQHRHGRGPHHPRARPRGPRPSGGGAPSRGRRPPGCGGKRHPFRRTRRACVRPRRRGGGHVHLRHHRPLEGRAPDLGQPMQFGGGLKRCASIAAARGCGRRRCPCTMLAACKWWCAAS